MTDGIDLFKAALESSDDASQAAVLLEEIKFLREQLEGRTCWLKQQLEVEQAKNKSFMTDWNGLVKERDKLRLCLVEAIREVTYHDLCYSEENDNDYETGPEMLTAWREVAKINDK